jgi:hypothetical protein
MSHGAHGFRLPVRLIPDGRPPDTSDERTPAMLTPEERQKMTREFLIERKLDIDTRSKIYFIASVYERLAEEDDAPEAADIYLYTCWTLSSPENLHEVDERYADAYDLGISFLMDSEG